QCRPDWAGSKGSGMLSTAPLGKRLSCRGGRVEFSSPGPHFKRPRVRSAFASTQLDLARNLVGETHSAGGRVSFAGSFSLRLTRPFHAFFKNSVLSNRLST